MFEMSQKDSPKADVQVGFRRGLLRHVSVVLGGASGMASALGAYELLERQPKEGFALLQSWGPAFLITLVAIFVLGQFLGGLNSTVRESFSIVAASVRDSAEAAGRTADALTRLADQGGKQAEEVRRLAIYAAQEFPSIYERFDRQDEESKAQTQALHDLMQSVKGLHARLREDKVERDHRGEG